MDKPGRPLGLSIAIIFSLTLYSLLPLVQAAFILTLRQQFAAVEFLEGGGAVGGGMEGINDTRLLLSVVSGIIFFSIAIMAWRGKPQGIRRVFVGAVIVVTLMSMGGTLLSMRSETTLAQGIDSSSALMDSLLTVQMVISGLIALYVIWYVNRGPARAFFRGYYLPEPQENAP